MVLACRLLLKASIENDRILNIPSLDGFIATAEQEQKSFSSNRIMNPIPGTEVDLEFGYALRQISMRARIAVNQPVNPHENPRAAGLVLQVVDRPAKRLGLLDAHGCIVSYGLHHFKRIRFTTIRRSAIGSVQSALSIPVYARCLLAPAWMVDALRGRSGKKSVVPSLAALRSGKREIVRRSEEVSSTKGRGRLFLAQSSQARHLCCRTQEIDRFAQRKNLFRPIG